MTRILAMQIKIELFTGSTPVGKVADAELHFTEGALKGLRLVGFGIWERRSGGGHNVTFPARSYSSGGEKRSYALLRPVGAAIASDDTNAKATDTIRDLILDAYREHIAEHEQFDGTLDANEARAAKPHLFAR